MDVKAVQLSSDKCILELDNGSLLSVEKIKILIHNEIFQLLHYNTATKNKKFLIFNDQLSFEELRLLHIKIGMMPSV